MRIASFILLAACTSGSTNDPEPVPCQDLGCASLPGTLTLTVVDATTQQPVKGTLTFTTPAQTLPFACGGALVDGACPSWKLSYEGAFDVSVVAPGYHTGLIHVEIDGPPGCCGTGPDTSDSLALTRAP